MSLLSSTLPFSTLPLFFKSGYSAVTTDTWPNEYTSMANIFQTVPEIEDLGLKFEHPGKVPDYVSGDFFILGPGRFEWGDSKYRGFLDANAITSKITIRNGGDESTNSVLKFDRKFIKSKTWEWNSEYNDIVISEFATYGEPKDLVPHPKKPLESMITRMQYFSGHISDNTIVKITEIFGQMIAFGEASSINVLDRDTLDTVAHVEIADAKAWPEGAMMLTQTAHGYFDKETDTVLSGSTILDMSGPGGIPVPAYAVLKYTRASEKIELEEIRRNPQVIADRVEVSDLIYAHEFNEEHGNHVQYNQYFHTSLVTEDFFILMLTNAALMPTTCAMTNTMQAKSIQDCYTVNPELDGIMIVLNKRTLKEVGRFRIDYLIAFHEINVFQTESDKNVIHLDVMNMGENANPFSIFPLDVINATSTDYQEKYYATMPGTTPAKLVLDLNSEKDEFGIMKAERIFMMEDAEDNNDWLNYMNAGADFPRVRPSDWGKSTYDEFYSNGLGSISPDRIYKTKISTVRSFISGEMCLLLYVVKSRFFPVLARKYLKIVVFSFIIRFLVLSNGIHARTN